MRVLIADDHRDSAETLAFLLRVRGFEPVLVYDGITALDMLQTTDSPVLALLDWNMPGLNGTDICRAIRQDTARPYTYIIMVTGLGSKEQMLEGLNAGADDYLLKPVQTNELHARLNAGKRILELQDQLLRTQNLLREQATRDCLTGVWNRAMILDILNRELLRGRREGRPLTVIMADVDHFKNINDTLGHLVGDKVLYQTAQRMVTVVRPYDTVGRFGGEEFLVVLSGCNFDVSMALAERLRDCVGAEPVLSDGIAVPVTISLGVAVWNRHSSAQQLLEAADHALYQAKAEGRNRVVAASER